MTIFSQRALDNTGIFYYNQRKVSTVLSKELMQKHKYCQNKKGIGYGTEKHLNNEKIYHNGLGVRFCNAVAEHSEGRISKPENVPRPGNQSWRT